MRARPAFMATIGIVLGTALIFLVIRPALERGGGSELAIVAAIFLGILLFERWLRNR